GANLNFFLASIRQGGGWDSLMRFFYNSSSLFNGYDQYGHYQRTNLIVSGCTTYKTAGTGDCNTRWEKERASSSSFGSILGELENLDELENEGVTGITGATGETGETGDTGITGATGETFPFGPTS